MGRKSDSIKKSSGSSAVLSKPVLKEIKNFWIAGNVALAIEKFHQGSLGADIPRLHDAYLWLRGEIDALGEEFVQQADLFNHVFLRIMEQRGETENPFYKEVLRDSREYKILSSLIDIERNALIEERPSALLDEEARMISPPPVEKSLKKILDDNSLSLKDYDMVQWCTIIEEHMNDYTREDSFVKRCRVIIKNISRREDRADYHLELMIVYCFERLSAFKKLTVDSKSFAMDALNMMTSRKEIWGSLHKEYLNIIRK